MASSSSTSVSIIAPQNTTVTIYNVSVTSVNTEITHALPANCRGFILRGRSGMTIKLTYTAGESGTKYLTINPGCVYEDNHFYTSQSIYFRSNVVGIIEILAFA